MRLSIDAVPVYMVSARVSNPAHARERCHCAIGIDAGDVGAIVVDANAGIACNGLHVYLLVVVGTAAPI